MSTSLKPKPKICLIRLAIYLSLFVCIIGLGTFTTSEKKVDLEEAQQMQRIIKSLDLVK